MYRLALLLCLISLSGLPLNYIKAQKNILQQQQLWYSYYNTLSINKYWQLQTDVQERHFINPLKQHQFLLRTHLHYRLSDTWSAGVGGALFLVGSANPFSTQNLIIPELRPHIEFNQKQKTVLFALSQRYRFEARFFHNTSGNELAEGYDFGNFRCRYRFTVEYPVKLKNATQSPLKLKFADEIFLNFGKNITYNTFDQNRIYLALIYALIPEKLSLETGYLHWFQQRSTGNAYFSRHIIYLSVQHKISL